MVCCRWLEPLVVEGFGLDTEKGWNLERVELEGMSVMQCLQHGNCSPRHHLPSELCVVQGSFP